MNTPFITFYTPTYRRPAALARCIASVQEQTAARAIEQIVIPDHAGAGGDEGVGAMFGRIQLYADAVHGEYVHILCDDDVLASPVVVEAVQEFIQAEGHPELVIVDVIKGPWKCPTDPAWPPRLSHIDLGCGIVRADVWKKHVAGYTPTYDGDFQFYRHLHEAGVKAKVFPFLFMTGEVSHGAAEEAA